jgi:peptide/nickel transport system substrate-binding protein
VARPLALVAAFAVALLAVSGAGGADAQAPRRGGTVVVASVPPEPACLNPFDEQCIPGTSQISALRIYGRVLQAPFEVAPDFTWRPRLVSDVVYTTKRPFTLTYRIRPEARWSDGVDLTAADFVFTHTALVRHGREDDLNRTEVRSVQAIDRKTIRVVLRSRLAPWRALFGSILPRHALRGENLLTVWRNGIVNPKTGEPIASGPFLTGRWVRGKQITLRRNPRYWGPHPAYVDGVVLRFAVDGDSLVDSFRSGEIDVAAGFPPSFFAEVDGEAGLRALAVDGTSMEHFALRLGPGGHPALRDKLVRRALAFGVDRRALARVALGELYRAAGTPRRDSIVFPTPSPYYRANWGRYGFRPAEARRLLERAGCRRGADGIYGCAGQRLALRFVAPVVPGGFRPRIVELAQTQLRRSGIEVVPVFAAGPVVFGQILPSGSFDVALFAWVYGPDPGWKDVFGCFSERNWMGYCQRLVTADLDQAQRILDARRQALVLNRADTQMAKDVPAIPLYEQPQWAAVRTTLRNFAPTAVDPLVNAESWWLAQPR